MRDILRLREKSKEMPVFNSGTVGDKKWIIKRFDNGRATKDTHLLMIDDDYQHLFSYYDGCMAFLDGIAYALGVEVNF